MAIDSSVSDSYGNLSRMNIEMPLLQTQKSSSRASRW
jgi:hypothetical protein